MTNLIAFAAAVSISAVGIAELVETALASDTLRGIFAAILTVAMM
jgi:hypothetical protein